MSEPDPIPEAAFRPLILLDKVPQGILLEGWRKRVGAADPDYPRAVLRVAELAFQTDPQRALLAAEEAEALGQDPARVAFVRASAWLEAGQPEAARPHADAVPAGPARTLLEARLALLGRREAEARALLDGLLDAPDVPPDLRADALSFRSRMYGEEGVEQSLGDLDALEQLCIEQKATLTGVWVGVLKKMLRSQGFKAFAEAISAFDLARLSHEAIDGVEFDPDSLGPIPPEVHGTLVKLRLEPQQAVEKLILLAALAWRVGQHARAHRIAVLGERLSRRVLGDRWADELRAFVDVLRGHAGEEVWAELSAALDRDAAGFLR